MTYQLEFSKGSVILNEEQYNVVTSPLCENQRILASAGSGKTTTITARIAYLIENYDINPQNILLVTFSRAAAQEMIHRVHKLIGPVQMYAGTFHALSAQILRDMAPRFLHDQPFIDELPYRLVKWLETERAKQWVKRFRTIIVDEFQDINDIQWKMLRLFHHQWATMTIVGDDAQNIYTWRGSSVEFILNFHNSVKNIKDYQLCRNYRSSEAIVTIANSVMRFIPTLPFKEKMIANMRGGIKPEVHYFFRASDEYDWVVHSIEKSMKLHPTKSFAVLSRYNHDLFKIEERLHLKNIPYNLCTQFDPENSSKKINKRITLATIHASKGLEWDSVFFMNLHDDIFPSRKSDEEIISERRLFYVGITRAKQELYLTYSRHERSLSRFVREIPKPFLTFYNISSFKLSTNNASDRIMSIEDMIRGFDGADWNKLRDNNSVPIINDIHMESIYKFSEMFTIPEWVKISDCRQTWFELLRWITLRECAIHMGNMDGLRTPEVNEALLTIRIYKEDLAFWEEYEVELEHLIHKFLKHTSQMPPVEYYQLEQYIQQRLPHLNWTIQEMSHALVIISKVRGQLRPLRHEGFDLNEFTFGCVRNSVPTELRPLVLKSWHKIQNKNLKTHDILPDLWRIASIKSIIQGRNIPLYQCDEIKEYFKEQEMQNITKAIENSIPLWLTPKINENIILNFKFEAEYIQPIQFDILTDKCAYYIYFDPSYVPTMEDKILLLLKQFVYEELFDRSLDSIGFLNVATGMAIQYEVTSLIREQMSHMWLHLQHKYLEAVNS